MGQETRGRNNYSIQTHAGSGGVCYGIRREDAIIARFSIRLGIVRYTSLSQT